MQRIYGTGIAYGGVLEFNNDGTFSKWIGITDGERDTHEGVYTVSESGESISFEYYCDDIADAKYFSECDRIDYYNVSVNAIEHFIRISE